MDIISDALFLFKLEINLLIKNKKNNGNKDANGIFKNSLLRKKLLYIEDIYWKVEIKPKRKCKFVNPKIILFSCKILIYGKWYRPASGRLTLALVTNKKLVSVTKKIIIINSPFFLKLKKKIKNIIKDDTKKIDPINLLIGKIKFIIKLINPIEIKPYIPDS